MVSKQLNEFKTGLWKPKAWDIWAEKELEVVGKYAHLGSIAAEHTLQELGLFRSTAAIKKAVKNKVIGKHQNKNKTLNLEQSYDARELITSYNLEVPRVADFCATTSRAVNYHARVIDKYMQPLAWSPAEDGCLIDGVDRYGADWAKIKDPLFGRSIFACKRRYQVLTRDFWSEEENDTLFQIVGGKREHELDTLDYSAMSAELNHPAEQIRLRARAMLYGDLLNLLPPLPEIAPRIQPNRWKPAYSHPAQPVTVEDTAPSWANSLYNINNNFKRMPKGPVDARCEVLPADRIPWTSGEIDILAENSHLPCDRLYPILSELKDKKL